MIDVLDFLLGVFEFGYDLWEYVRRRKKNDRCADILYLCL